MARKPDSAPDIASHALSALLRDTLASGRKPLDTPDVAEAVAVHDLRKSLKRWRAILRLIEPVVGAEAEVLRVEARDLAREMASARDGQAALEALADLGCDPPSLSARSRASIAAKIAVAAAGTAARAGTGARAGGAARAETAAGAGPAAGAGTACLTPALKARIAEAFARAAAAAERWPLARFDRDAATRELAATYRRAGAALPDDWTNASAEALHRLRRRVVEHRYQMELVEPAWPKLVKVWVSEAQRLRDRLGAHQDLSVLQRLTTPNQPLAPWRSRLAPLIAARQAAHAASAQRLAGRLFAERPKDFRRRLAALWRQRAG